MNYRAARAILAEAIELSDEYEFNPYDVHQKDWQKPGRTRPPWNPTLDGEPIRGPKGEKPIWNPDYTPLSGRRPGQLDRDRLRAWRDGRPQTTNPGNFPKPTFDPYKPSKIIRYKNDNNADKFGRDSAGNYYHM